MVTIKLSTHSVTAMVVSDCNVILDVIVEEWWIGTWIHSDLSVLGGFRTNGTTVQSLVYIDRHCLKIPSRDLSLGIVYFNRVDFVFTVCRHVSVTMDG